MDVTGNVVKEFSSVKQFPFTIERGDMASGIYILEFRSEAVIERMKLIVE